MANYAIALSTEPLETSLYETGGIANTAASKVFLISPVRAGCYVDPSDEKAFVNFYREKSNPVLTGMDDGFGKPVRKNKMNPHTIVFQLINNFT